jgi:hypothetical protein
MNESEIKDIEEYIWWNRNKSFSKLHFSISLHKHSLELWPGKYQHILVNFQKVEDECHNIGISSEDKDGLHHYIWSLQIVISTKVTWFKAKSEESIDSS